MKKDVSYSNDRATFVKLLESLDKRIEAKIEVKEIRKIIDSSQLTSSAVNDILELINSFHKKYDGFLIVTGTDTMAYLQSFLNWSIDGLEKPIILTWAINTAEVDLLEGINNISDSIRLLENNIGKPLIGIFMNKKLFKRPVTKFNSCSKISYLQESFSYLEKQRKRYFKSGKDFQIYFFKENLEVEYLHIHPLIGKVEGNLKDALIITAYGQGTIMENSNIREKALEYQRQKKPIIVISQSMRNRLDIKAYAAGGF